MTLTEFTALVKDEANKGDRLDDSIAARVKMAVMRGERRYTLKYLERFVTLDLEADADEPRVVAFPANNGLKSINFMRYTADSTNDTDGDYVYLKQVDPGDVNRDDACEPTGYWLDGVRYIWFDNTVQEDLQLEFSYNSLSDWPPTDGTHWLLTNASDWLLCETMKLLSTKAKEPTWIEKYKIIQADAELALFTADNELRNSDRDYIMLAPGSAARHRARYPGDDG